MLRDGVYLLPHREPLQQALAEQVQAVQTLRGSRLAVGGRASHDTDAQFQALFDRSEDYAALLATIAHVRGTLAEATEAQARRQLQQIRREYEALVAIDYFPGPAQAQCAQAVAEAEAAVTRHFSPDEPQPLHAGIRQLERTAYRGKRWATRHRVWVDRVASAWLIRRFIDPDARFLWLTSPQDCPADAIGFDFDGAVFTHTGQRVTFEVFVASFALETDPALARLGMLVHALDVGGCPCPRPPDSKRFSWACGHPVRTMTRWSRPCCLCWTPSIRPLGRRRRRGGRSRAGCTLQRGGIRLGQRAVSAG